MNFKRLPNLHPNGFWIYLVKAFWNGARIRIHYWPRGVKRLDTPHNHRSWFVSLPLWGTFLETRFKKAAGDRYQVLKCHATSSGNGKPNTTPAGTGNVIPIAHKWRYPFMPYFCGLEDIHSFKPWGDGPALTIVFFGPPKRTPKAWME